MSSVPRSVLRLLLLGVLITGGTLGVCLVSADDPTANPAASFATKQPVPDWAEKYLDQDPLAKKKIVTLEDLDEAMKDKQRRETVIHRHFSRATGLTDQEKESFLRKALQDDSLVVGRQAAAELNRLGWLEKVVAERLLGMMVDDSPDLRQAAVIGLERIKLKANNLSDQYFDALTEACVSDDPRVKQAAERQLEELGTEAVPHLLQTLEGDDPEFRKVAALLLSRIVGSKRPREANGEVPSPEDQDTGGLVPPPKGVPREKLTPPQVRKVDEEKSESVRVYYGTNREKLDTPSDPWTKLTWYPLLIASLLGLLFVRFRQHSRKSDEDGSRRRAGCFGTVVTLLCLLVVAWSISELNTAVREYYSHHRGVKFGPRRAGVGAIVYGYCDVSIPLRHEQGEVEQPLIGPEDESKHVVIKQTTAMSDQQFYTAVKQILADQATDSRDCFVFIHGFCVSFDDAARRTAQIHYDLEFQGVPMFYSWPSRGSIRHYFSDRNEIRYSHEHIRRFLEGVLENVDANRIHVIAHSMGADALCQAIAQMDPQQRVFDQIILAAPDIDADVFKQQILPRLTDKGRRTTLYCSRKDWALQASYTFNDTPRAGDSSRGVLVAPDLDTIEASEIDTELLGHSYYGDCLPLLKDVGILLRRNLSPQERKLQPRYRFERLPYWTLTGE